MLSNNIHKLFNFISIGKLAPVFFLAISSVSYASHEKPVYLSENLPITDSMVTTWFFSLVIIIALRLLIGAKKPSLVPTKGQIVVETVVLGLKNMLASVVGKKVIDQVFPLLICFFIFILIMNWSGLLPGVGSFGAIDENGHLVGFFRPANSDLNTTLALSLISFIAWTFFCIKNVGVKAFLYDMFGNKADKSSLPKALYVILIFVFLAVGCIELVSTLLRILSLSFRLFGNVLGGETLLSNMLNLCPFISFPFYFLELLVGLIQAFVFTLLSAVYIGLICNHDSAEEH